MSIELNVFAPKIGNELLPEWMARMNQMDMTCEIYPGFSFESHSGFLPFKMVIKNPASSAWTGRQFLTGFEFYLQAFDLQKELEYLRPKKNFFQKAFERNAEEEIFFINQEIDRKLAACACEMTFSYGFIDAFEYRMAMLSAAVLTELSSGICYHSADDTFHDYSGIVDKFYRQVVEYEQSANCKECQTHPFLKWE